MMDFHQPFPGEERKSKRKQPGGNNKRKRKRKTRNRILETFLDWWYKEEDEEAEKPEIPAPSKDSEP